MATKKIYIGNYGPFEFDDSVALADPDGDFTGENRKAFISDKQILITEAPTADNNVIRLDDINGRIYAATSVADIDDPSSELGAIASVNGSILMVYEVSANENEWTMYVYDSAVGTGVNIPYTVAGSSGFWIAVAGKYSIFSPGINNLTASRLVASSASKVLESVADLTSWIAGTANRITIADDGDGTITISAPQDLHTSASPTFGGFTKVGDASNYITVESDGEITLTGTARVKKEFTIPLNDFAPGASGATAALNGIFQSYEFGINNTMHTSFELPSDCDTSEDITIEVYWAIDETYAANSGEVQWSADWRAIAVGESVTAGGTSGTVDLGDVNIPATANILVKTTEVIAAASISQDDLIALEWSRVALDDGNNPTAEPYIIMVNIEYYANKLGNAA